MTEAAIQWTEIVFNLAYLVTVWGLVAALVARRSRVAPKDKRVANLVTWAFTLLALGDTGHVGFRVVGYAVSNLELTLAVAGGEVGLVGLGAMATAFTVTLFYVVMLYIWKARFDRRFGWFQLALLAAAAVRVGLMMPPANEWNQSLPPQPWSTYRNLPLMVQGLGVAYLILRDAIQAEDRAFRWIGVMILVSYACYIPVVFFVQRVPMVGMLMIPKTVAYLVIGFLAYQELFQGRL